MGVFSILPSISILLSILLAILFQFHFFSNFGFNLLLKCGGDSNEISRVDVPARLRQKE